MQMLRLLQLRLLLQLLRLLLGSLLRRHGVEHVLRLALGQLVGQLNLALAMDRRAENERYSTD